MKKLLLLLLLFASLGGGCCHLDRVQQSQPLDSLTHFESPGFIAERQWPTVARKNGIDIRTGESSRPVTVLGHYPEYVELTEKLGAESMQIPMDRWDALAPEEQWQTTTGFFDWMIRAGHNFRLATPVERARAGSYYVRELNYLFSKRYRVSPDGLWLVR